MLRSVCGLIMVVLWSIAPMQNEHQTATEGLRLDGVYNFVSETIAVTRPKKLTEQFGSSDWDGLWLFTGGHFSQTLMKKHRQFWLPRFPRSAEALGYRSAAGTYKIDGDTLELIPNLHLSPYYLEQPWLLKYRLEGEMLTLTETLYANPHNENDGQRTILLRRVK